MFAEMMGRIQANAVTKMFRVQAEKQRAADVPAVQERARQLAEHGAANKSEDETADDEAQQQRRPRRGSVTGKPGEPTDGAKLEPVRREKPKVGRNDPCPCGSGKKYKKCHGKDEEASATE